MRWMVIVAALMFAAPAFAADTPPAAPPLSCNAAENHQMDFWLGDWKLTWDGGSGTNHVTKEFGGCVVHENFRAEAGRGGQVPLAGNSFSVYQASNQMWRQAWVDNQDGFFDLTGGPQKDGTFLLAVVRMGREPSLLRMVFSDIKKDSFTWHWQMSDDGAVWTDKWVVHYRRTK